MKWFLYNVLFAIGYTLMMPKFLMRMWRRGGYRKGFMQRVGVFDDETLAQLREKRRVWIHAVSVGEAYVAARFLRAMRAGDPGLSVVFSVTTSTGHKVAQSFLSDEDVLLYFPADFPWAVRRVLATVAPLAVIYTESEFWPNFMRQCRARGVKQVLINGRVSDRSFPRYRKMKAFFGPVLRCLDLLLVQGEVDRERLTEMGAVRDRIHVLGSAKYDMGVRDEAAEARTREYLAALGFGAEAFVLLGASTWPGEERALVRVLRKLRKEHPELRLALVPRHAERGDEVAAEIRAAGEQLVQRSQSGEQVPARPEESVPPVLLADTTGELATFYAAADLVFVGKSLCSHGGQNFIEPAAFGKPVMVGPNTENFPTVIRDFREEDSILEVADEADLLMSVRRCLKDREYAAALAARGLQTVTRRAGVVARSLVLIEGVFATTESEK